MMSDNYNISYHCKSYNQICKVIQHYSDMVYTFNGSSWIGLGSKENDEPYKKSTISKGKNVVESSGFISRGKVKEDL